MSKKSKDTQKAETRSPNTEGNQTTIIQNKIILQSAKGHWSESLNKLFSTDNFVVNNWDLDMTKNDETKKDNDKVVLEERISSITTKNNLHIFIAPITWAYENADRDFITTGPAFATNDDLLLLARKNFLTNNIDKKITIGIIDDGITSSISLKLLLHYLENTIKIKFHRFFEKNPNLNIENNEIELEINEKYFWKKLPDPVTRLSKLTNENHDMDLAIFTKKDLFELSEMEKEYLLKVNELLRIENSLIEKYKENKKSKICCLPRTVYCIHKSQITKQNKDLLNILNNKLNEIFGRKDDLSKGKKDIDKIMNKIYPINPNSDIYIKAQKDFISEAIKKSFITKELTDTLEIKSLDNILEEIE